MGRRTFVLEELEEKEDKGILFKPHWTKENKAPFLEEKGKLLGEKIFSKVCMESWKFGKIIRERRTYFEEAM